MDSLIDQLNNGYVLAYVVLMVLIQLCYSWYRRSRARGIDEKRRGLGLPEGVLVNQSKKLFELKRESVTQALVLLIPMVCLPLLLVILSGVLNGGDGAAPVQGGEESAGPGTGLFFAFLLILGWLAFTATDLAKATIGGIAFRTVMTLANTVQIGDRVTINGQSGKLVDVGIYYLTLNTVDDDKICIPTNTLWGASLVSANDGDRSSLCVIPFYLAPSVSRKQLQSAEDAIWDAIQASLYFEPTKPKQIYYNQHPQYIELTAKSYVASTYNEPLYRSEIIRYFLAFAKENNILLASESQLVTLQGDSSGNTNDEQ